MSAADEASAREAGTREAGASIFNALGHEARLALIGKLSRGQRQSISLLADGLALTRQGVTKHLRVLEQAGLVRNSRVGRESLFELEPNALAVARRRLEDISAQWDDALGRLKTFVEE
jgi:DNA-binding transcriptional ArsR family regulator